MENEKFKWEKQENKKKPAIRRVGDHLRKNWRTYALGAAVGGLGYGGWKKAQNDKQAAQEKEALEAIRRQQIENDPYLNQVGKL